ncbi:uncharacterized protein LOC111278450 [Durio zibethinus]|uniref:Uncharacterized protein LOC111278450 n=1 Tax=Durio zibethinus TaxID=66656 RepID=A0A6P5WXF9_DURZI|nr:uncharacterized protein LOC111278450 [Durio zibethinus]
MASTWKKLKKSLIRKISTHQRHSSSGSSSFSANSIASSPSPSSASRSSSLLSYSFSFRSSKDTFAEIASVIFCQFRGDQLVKNGSFSVLLWLKICAICLGSLKKGEGQAIFTAECCHPFHFNCIATNVKHGNLICPICRSEWKDIPFQAPENDTDSRRHNSIGQAWLENDHFSDDESLPTIHAGPASSNRLQTITIKALPEFPAVLALDAVSKFAILVGIRSPSFHVDVRQFHRAPIDLVAVLDVSGSMAGKPALLQRAVCFIIQNMGPSDRLSVVTFSLSARRILPL